MSKKDSSIEHKVISPPYRCAIGIQQTIAFAAREKISYLSPKIEIRRVYTNQIYLESHIKPNPIDLQIEVGYLS